MEDEVKLIPVAMVRPNSANVYAPSRIEEPKEISKDEFLVRYADSGRLVQVSFEADGYSNPQPTTAYGRGLDCWWIVGGS